MTSINSSVSSPLIRTLGYGLFIFAILDIFAALIPPSFKNAAWELQTFGEMVERCPIPLIGLILIFYAENNNRLKFESFILKALSWISLLLGILLVGFMALGLSATFRINTQNTLQIDAQRNKGLSQLEQVQANLEKANDAQLDAYLKKNTQNAAPTIQSPQQLRQQVSKNIADARKQLQRDSTVAMNTKRNALVKSSVKWSFSGIIAAFIYFYIWRNTVWARKLEAKQKW
jgi:hypothetical protein